MEIVDRVRDLGWPGVTGNTDEILFRPESLREVARRSLGLETLFDAIEQMAAATREKLGESRVAWLHDLPRVQAHEAVALVHASPGDLWKAPGPGATDAEFKSVYASLGKPVVVYGHIHRPFVRTIGEMVIANSGSAGLPYDGDPRAAYLLIDGSQPVIRRVEYDRRRELDLISASGPPHAGWIARMIQSAAPEMP